MNRLSIDGYCLFTDDFFRDVAEGIIRREHGKKRYRYNQR